MKVVIYGINKDTEEIINSLKNTSAVVAISDSFMVEESLYGYRFLRPEYISEVEYDYIVVCVKTRNTFEAIKRTLVKYGNIEEKILSFHNLYYESRIDQVMLEAKANNRVFDGLIIGISHAAYAINPQHLKGKWANIAVPSEDIINHNYVFDKLVKEYYEQIRNLSRIIIDLYDYTVLNFITSYSRYNVDFYDLYCGDGVENQASFKQLEKKISARGNYSSYYARKYRALRQELFDDERVFSNYKNNAFRSPTPIEFFYKECVYCGNEIDPLGNGVDFIPKIQNDSNTKTNIEQLWILIRKVYEINPDIKVYLILIPRYAEVEKNLLNEVLEYKELLYCEIEKLKGKYPGIAFLDYKGINDISLFKKGYCSVGHMNVEGQNLFTQKLNKAIFGGE